MWEAGEWEAEWAWCPKNWSNLGMAHRPSQMLYRDWKSDSRDANRRYSTCMMIEDNGRRPKEYNFRWKCQKVTLRLIETVHGIYKNKLEGLVATIRGGLEVSSRRLRNVRLVSFLVGSVLLSVDGWSGLVERLVLTLRSAVSAHDIPGQKCKNNHDCKATKDDSSNDTRRWLPRIAAFRISAGVTRRYIVDIGSTAHHVGKRRTWKEATGLEGARFAKITNVISSTRVWAVRHGIRRHLLCAGCRQHTARIGAHKKKCNPWGCRHNSPEITDFFYIWASPSRLTALFIFLCFFLVLLAHSYFKCRSVHIYWMYLELTLNGYFARQRWFKCAVGEKGPIFIIVVIA